MMCCLCSLCYGRLGSTYGSAADGESTPWWVEIDLHPLTFAPDGSAVQASLEPDRPFVYPARCFVTGTIGGSAVGCLSAEQQVYFHQGYEPKDRDRHDMAQLRAAFGVDTPF